MLNWNYKTNRLQRKRIYLSSVTHRCQSTVAASRACTDRDDVSWLALRASPSTKRELDIAAITISHTVCLSSVNGLLCGGRKSVPPRYPFDFDRNRTEQRRQVGWRLLLLIPAAGDITIGWNGLAVAIHSLVIVKVFFTIFGFGCRLQQIGQFFPHTNKHAQNGSGCAVALSQLRLPRVCAGEQASVANGRKTTCVSAVGNYVFGAHKCPGRGLNYVLTNIGIDSRKFLELWRRSVIQCRLVLQK